MLTQMKADLSQRVLQSLAYVFRKVYRKVLTPPPLSPQVYDSIHVITIYGRIALDYTPPLSPQVYDSIHIITIYGRITLDSTPPLSPQVYDSIHIDTQGFRIVSDLLSNAERLCQAEGPRAISRPLGGKQPLHEPVILLPMHRSYVDFLVLSFLLFAQSLPVPHIAANEDFLGLAGVNLVLRKAGAFYLRRKFAGDQLYTAVFGAYVAHLIETCPALEFYLEGTRSRTGKFIHPRTGLLSIVVKSFFEGRVKDIHFAPVALNYEKVTPLLISLA